MTIKNLALSSRIALAATTVLAIGAFAIPASVFADTGSTDFESFTTNSSVNGQGGWSATGPYDQSVVSTADFGSPSGFGTQALRLSNAVTTGAFGDQTFAAPLADAVGEASSTNGTFSAGTLQNMYDAQFDIAAASSTPQVGLAISVSPDRGDGSRMSYLRFEDTASGIDVYFDDVQGTSNPANFVETKIATLDRTIPHHIELSLETLDGPSNDIVKVSIDHALVHTGTSWENYYRFDNEASAEQSPRIVKTLIFRAGGTPYSADSGYGFLFDNVDLTSSTVTPPSTSTVVVNSAWAGDSAGTTESGSYVYGINAFSDLQSAVNAVSTGGTIEVQSDLSVSSEVTVGKALTINGNGHTLAASFTTTGNDNNAALGIVEVSGDVTVNNLIENGAGSTGLHGINIFDAGNVLLNAVTVENNTKSGITDNGANVTVNNITTKNNAWGGINADLAADATNATTTLTVTGTSVHDETSPAPAIWRDDDSKNVHVTVNGQYTSSSYTHGASITGTIWNLTPGCTLTFNPTTYASGGSSTLSWSCVSVTDTVLTDYNGATTTVADSGSQSVSIGTAGAYTYSLSYIPNGTTTSTSTSATVTVTSSAGGGGGGGGGSIGGSGGGSSNPLPGTTTTTTTTTTTGGGQVLGASTFNFTKDLWFHMKNNSDVAQLQTYLVAAGYSIPDAVTQFFGSETLAAVKAFQKAHGLPVTGYVGPLTRAILNQGVIPTTPEGTTNLTPSQANAIISVLESFGADAATIAQVRAALGL